MICTFFTVDGLNQYDAMMSADTSYTGRFVKVFTTTNEYQRMYSTNKDALKAYFMWGRDRYGWNIISSHDSVADFKLKGHTILNVFRSLQCFMLLNKHNTVNSIITDGIHEVSILV